MDNVTLIPLYTTVIVITATVGFILACFLAFVCIAKTVYDSVFQRGLTTVPNVDRNIGMMTQDDFKKGMVVNVRHRRLDAFSHDFTGTVIGYHGEFVIVEDMDGNCWDCDAEQLTLTED